MDRIESRLYKVLVMHTEPLVAAGLVAALRLQADLDILVHGIDVYDARAAASVDVIVADYAQGVRLAAEFRRAGVRDAKVLVMTTHDREHEVRRALEQGVHGYLLLGCTIDELVDGVRTLARGARYLCMTVAQRVADSLTREALTSRERDVLRLLSLGQCNKAIARELEIAVGTVKSHVKAIMEKLDASSRTEAASIATQRGMVDDDCGMHGEQVTRALRASGHGVDNMRYA
jgi:DNA-binding NarL/FixJ family response regulator